MSTVSETIMSWPFLGGNVVLSSDAEDGLIASVETNGKTHRVMKEWIVGIPKEIQNDPQILRRFLLDTSIRLGSVREDEIILRINPRLRGGMIGAVAALGGGFFSSVSSVMNFCTSSNYVKLARTAGSEARATIRVGGVEARATIDKAEESAKNTLVKMGTEVRTSIDKAQKSAQEVIKTAGSEMNNTIGLAGIETRHTSKVMELQVENALGKAGREAQLILETAGVESKQAILLYGEEARKSCFALSGALNSSIKTASQETNAILSKGSFEVKSILDKANQDVKGIIQLASDEFQVKSTTVINEALSRAERVIAETMKLASLQASGLIEQLGKEAQGVILNMGAQGQLLIKDTGNEIRVIADEVLKKAFAGQEMIINVAGEEARLTVQCVGKELRSTLYELPSITGFLGEQLGRNLVFGLRDGLFGMGEAEELVHKLKNLKGSNDINIQDLLKFVYDQTQLIPQKKSVLYKTLINLFNTPTLKERDRENLMLMIGVAALKDEGLVEKDGIIRYGKDYRQVVIERVPGEVGARLKAEGEEAIKSLMPRIVEAPVIPAESVNVFEMEFEKEKLRTKALEAELINAKNESVLLKILYEEEKKRSGDTAATLAKIQAEASDFSNQVKDLQKYVEKQKREIEFLQPSEVNEG